MAAKCIAAVLLSTCLIINYCSIARSQIIIPYNLLLVKDAAFYILPFLAHNLEDFEPHMGSKAMEEHFDGDFGWYKYEMNKVLSSWREDEPDNPLAFESILTIMQRLPEVSQDYLHDIHFYGGGFVNHCFYFALLSPNPEGFERSPTGYLLKEINQNFGDLDGLKKEIEDSVKLIRGSGYIWVVRLPGKEGDGALSVLTTSDQDSPVIAGLHPILCIDMWEHAYYLKHTYNKWEYLKDFWMVLDWTYVERLDQWWQHIEEQQMKADERVEALKRTVMESERVAQEAEDEAKAEL